jgi:protein TonB
MSDAIVLPLEAEDAIYPSVKPPWLPPVATVFVIAMHAAVALISVLAPTPVYHVIDATLVPYGDPFGSLEGPFGVQEQATDEEETPPPEPAEASDEPDLAIPPPMIVSPDALPDPTVKHEIDQKKMVAKHRTFAEHAPREGGGRSGNQLAGASGRGGGPRGHRPLGLPEGRAAAGSQMGYAALLAIAIRQHTPPRSDLGPGSAHVVFHVTGWGAIVGISASGSTPAHAALARRIVGSVHAPPPPGGSYFASQEFDFH